MRTCATYTGPGAGWALHIYDRSGQPDILQPVDALAPALLDAPVRHALLVKLFARMPNRTAAAPHFESLNLDDDSGPWMLVRRVLRPPTARAARKATMFTKMLHRKRPPFVPIFDSKVAAFLWRHRQPAWGLCPALQADACSATDLLDHLRTGGTTPTAGRSLGFGRRAS